MVGVLIKCMHHTYLAYHAAIAGPPLGSHTDLCAILDAQAITPARVCIHCFTGSEDHLRDYLHRGYMIGLTGYVTMHKRGAGLRQSLSNIARESGGRQLLLSRLMVETDAPFMRPDLTKEEASRIHLRGRKNEPCALPEVARTVATCLGMTAGAVGQRTTENATRFFELKRIKFSC